MQRYQPNLYYSAGFISMSSFKATFGSFIFECNEWIFCEGIFMSHSYMALLTENSHIYCFLLWKVVFINVCMWCRNLIMTQHICVHTSSLIWEIMKINNEQNWIKTPTYFCYSVMIPCWGHLKNKWKIFPCFDCIDLPAEEHLIRSLIWPFSPQDGILYRFDPGFLPVASHLRICQFNSPATTKDCGSMSGMVSHKVKCKWGIKPFRDSSKLPVREAAVQISWD